MEASFAMRKKPPMALSLSNVTVTFAPKKRRKFLYAIGKVGGARTGQAFAADRTWRARAVLDDAAKCTGRPGSQRPKCKSTTRSGR